MVVEEDGKDARQRQLQHQRGERGEAQPQIKLGPGDVAANILGRGRTNAGQFTTLAARAKACPKPLQNQGGAVPTSSRRAARDPPDGRRASTAAAPGLRPKRPAPGTRPGMKGPCRSG